MIKGIYEYPYLKHIIKLCPESFQLQMGFSFPFLCANDIYSSLLNIRARSFLLSCM